MKSTLAYPNGLTASWTCGNRSELLEVNNASPTGTISRYVCTYDAAGRRIGCDKSGSAFTTPDTYAYRYNTRSELTNATAAVDALYRYAYDFDDIGNRKTSAERGEETSYFANPLNQYTNIEYSADQPSPVTAEHSGDGTSNLQPLYDADGNQTLVKTATGIWQVEYNGENRPILWTLGTNTISMSFDRMGRRVTKNNQRFVYNGYLQVANYHLSSTNYHLFVWDPTEPVATRPLVWTRNDITSYYAFDGNKNVSEVLASDGTVSAHYEYAPFGAVTVSRGTSAATNPFRFSSEYAEDDTATVYYNYRHYEPVTGRWMNRDPIGEIGGICVYGYISNKAEGEMDWCGLKRMTRAFAMYDFDKGKCMLNVTLRWMVYFNAVFNGVAHENWTEHEKAEWKDKAKNSIEGYFNSLPFRCDEERCSCKDGIRVNVSVQFVEKSWLNRLLQTNPDYDSLVVVSKYQPRAHVNPDSGRLDCSQDDVTMRHGRGQIVIVHEAGHLLGLNHPGMYTQKRDGSTADYEETYNGLPGEYNLMGSGMALHYDDFKRAFCDHLK